MKSITAIGLVLALSMPGVATAVPEGVPRAFVPAAPSAQRFEGIVAERMRKNLEGRLLRVDEAGLLDGFRNRPGKQEWIGEHAGKFLDAASRTWLHTRDARLKTLMDRVARELIATQEPDGYLGTYVTRDRWTSWDVWVHKYDLMGLLAYHRATGDKAALAAAVRAGDLLVATFSSGKRDLVAAGTHVGMAATSVLGPMVDLYRQTDDGRYLAFARHVVASYEQPNGPKIVSTLLAKRNVHETANAKAYEMLSNLIGLVDLHTVTGDGKLLEAVLIAWQDVVDNRLYITGTASSREHFQPAHVLPAEVKNNIGETCVTVNWLELNLALLRLRGEPRFAEQIERTLWNHLLGAQDARNGDFCYYTPLNGKKPYGPGINCCVSSGPRGIAMVPDLTFGLLHGSPVVWQWIPGRVRLEVPTRDGAVPVDLTVRTDFPVSGRVRIDVSPARPASFALALRVPAWATRFAVNGQAEGGKPGALWRLERTWKRGDRLEIDMDLPVRLVSGAPSYPGRVAIVRGPQVLALDATVNPDVADRTLAALERTDEAPALATAGRSLPAGFRQAFSVPGVVVTQLDRPVPTRATKPLLLVPFADARTPQTWLLGTDRLDEVVAERRARESRRPKLGIKRATGHIRIDGKPDEPSFATKLAMEKKAGPSSARSKASFALAWDDEALYVAAWVTDPTPETRNHVGGSDHVAVAVDGNRGVEGLMREVAVHAVQAWEAPVVTEGIRRASAKVPGGYTVEMAIPWSRVRARPEPGAELAFEIRNHDQGRVGVEDDGDWQWASESAENDLYGIVRLE